jgi:hypothetical protein
VLIANGRQQQLCGMFLDDMVVCGCVRVIGARGLNHLNHSCEWMGRQKESPCIPLHRRFLAPWRAGSS